MSGPKGIEYQIAQERRALEDARTRLAGLRTRYASLQTRGELHGVAVPPVTIPKKTGSTSQQVRDVCAEVERQVKAAEGVVEAELGLRNIRAAAFTFDDDLARLAAEDEQARAASRQTTQQQAAPSKTFDAEAHRRAVAQKLSSAETVTEEVRATARTALTAATNAEAKLALADLSKAVSTAARAGTRVRAQRAELAELRSVVGALLEPDALEKRLEAIQGAIDAGHDVGAALEQVAGRAEVQRESESAARDRRTVLDSVRRSLTALGYEPVEVSVGTADAFHAQRPGTPYAVEVTVDDAELGLRTLRDAAAPDDRAADRAADQTLCTQLDQVLLKNLSADGIEPGRIRKQPPGLVRPAAVALIRSSTSGAGANASAKSTAAKKKAAAVTSRRLKEQGGSR